MPYRLISNLNGRSRQAGSGDWVGAVPEGVTLHTTNYPLAAGTSPDAQVKLSAGQMVACTQQEIDADDAQVLVDAKIQIRKDRRADLKRMGMIIEFIRRMVNETPPVTRNRADRMWENVVDAAADDEV